MMVKGDGGAGDGIVIDYFIQNDSSTFKDSCEGQNGFASTTKTVHILWNTLIFIFIFLCSITNASER